MSALSLILPCYDEEQALPGTVADLLGAFAGVDMELVLVDNGSRDGTGAVIDGLVAAGAPVTAVHVPINRGYGHGVRAGLSAARGQVLGFLCADGQVAAQDVRALYDALRRDAAPGLYKVRRRFRPDGWDRKVASVGWNLLANAALGGLSALDVNGNPKLWPRQALDPATLTADDWFLDAEVLLAARAAGLRVVERDVRARARQGGRSKVRASTCLDLALSLAQRRSRS